VMERLVIYHAGRDVEPQDLGLPQSLRTSLYPFVPGAPYPSMPSSATPSSGFPSFEVVPRAPAPAPSGSRAGLIVDGLEFRGGGFEVPPASTSQPDLEPPMSRPRMDVDAIAPGALSLDLPEGGTTFDELEREILVQVLARADNNQSRAARSLGMSESTFRSRLKRLGLMG
jgi:DNA-binding NtrC family response regulator